MRNIILFLFIAGLSTASNAENIKNGDKLHADKCTRCHDSTLYTRASKRVKTLPKLGTQVRMCKDNLGITWFDDEVDDVTGYLNKNYYHF
ncbi:MAG: cytochrome c [Gammaproteobacteria bacterium]|nr:cytochrome c [Gammaproteobacteria bacterium]